MAHEALLSGWPAFRTWLDEEAAARETAERLRRAAAEWERVGRAEERSSANASSWSSTGTSFDRGGEAFVRASRRRSGEPQASLGAPDRRPADRAPPGAGGRLGYSLERSAAGSHAFVAARLAEADPAFRSFEDLDAKVSAARMDAFAPYDAADTPGGEARWRDALALARSESAAFVATSAPLGLALARDPLDRDARARAADVA